ncbi:MAG: hypothetical protein AAFS10_09205, partial [Myxococcota bacterium]
LQKFFAGRLELARAQWTHLESWRRSGVGHAPALVERIGGMLARADTLDSICPLDDEDLRGWHAVITGGVLLHLSPFGFDEGMRGRYAFLQDDTTLCAEAIARLHIVVEATALHHEPRVLLLDDRPSEILGLGLASALGWPTCPLAEHPQAPGLIVSYDISALEPQTLGLGVHHPGQALWSHVTPWTQHLPIAADVTTLLAQFIYSPWEGHLHVEEQTGELIQGPADDRGVETLAAELSCLPLPEVAPKESRQLVEMCQALEALGHPHGAGWCRAKQGVPLQRPQGWRGGPVKSNLFR